MNLKVLHRLLNRGILVFLSVLTWALDWNLSAQTTSSSAIVASQTKPASIPASSQTPVSHSPCAIVATADGKAVYVAEFSAKRVVKVNLATGQIQDIIPLDLPPSGLALDPASSILYITLDAPEGKIFGYNTQSSSTMGEPITVGHTPMAPVLSPDKQILAVCNRFHHNVSLIHLSTRKETKIPLIREPVAAAFSPSGNLLAVVNHLPLMPSTHDLIAATVSFIDPLRGEVIHSTLLANGSTGVKGICISPEGKFAYVTHTLARYQVPATQIERGWIATSAVSILDLTSFKLVGTILLDDVDQGAANPWGLACSEKGDQLFIAHAGTHELSVIDRQALHQRLDLVSSGKKVSMSTSLGDISDDLGFLAGIRQRLSLPGNGPRALCLTEDSAVIGMYFSDTLAVLPLQEKPAPLRTLPLGNALPQSLERQGERLFHDAQMSFQKWLSCSSCHPDGRSDALNWDLMNDGIGNPKNVKSLLHAFQTPPTTWLGVRANANVSVRAGIRHILFSARPEEEAKAIDAYLMNLKPIPSPRLVKGQLSDSALRGKKLFDTTGCIDCHTGPHFTDLSFHKMVPNLGVDQGKAMDTPTLIECWRNAPYLHDGRALTIKDMLRKHDPDNSFSTKDLTDQECDDLIEYVLSL